MASVTSIQGRDLSLIPGPQKIPQLRGNKVWALRLLRWYTATTEAHVPRGCALQPKATGREKPLNCI